MPTVNVCIYLTDKEILKYIPKKEQIMETLKKTIKEELNKV